MALGRKLIDHVKKKKVRRLLLLRTFKEPFVWLSDLDEHDQKRE